MQTGVYVIMMQTYFVTNIPDSIIEATQIDGAGELGYWLNGLYYISDDNTYSIQALLNKMLLSTKMIMRAAGTVEG